MDKDLEEYLRSVAIPEHEAHRQDLRRKLLNEMKQKQRSSPRKKSTAVVYAFIALACISALLVADIINWKYQASIILNEERDSNTVPKIIDLREYGGATMWGSRAFEMPSGVPDSMDWYPL
jgi:hypothetical protein